MSSVIQLGQFFPDQWLWSKYEKRIFKSLVSQVESQFPNAKNLVINLTWFGPQFKNGIWNKAKNAGPVDNLFLLCTVDPAMINPDQINELVESLGNPVLFKIGNFDGDYHFNFFAPVLVENFKHYQDDELLLTDPRWLFINYNRKPRQHRVEFVKLLQEKNLDKHGLITLGKHNVIYDKDASNDLYLSLGEESRNYVAHGHWYDPAQEDEFGIPHDVLSLHNMHYWKHHFLHIIGATEFNVWDDIFVSETQFKPMIGLRPFLINGNPRTYQWLTDHGFRTFNHWFPGIDFENPDTVHESLCQAIENLVPLSKQALVDLYNRMLPDLIYNRNQFYKFAQEQYNRTNSLFPTC